MSSVLIKTVEAKLEGKIDSVEAKIEGKIDKVDAKYEERTKLGFWGFIFRGSALAVLPTSGRSIRAKSHED
jgi:hypothetical protein